MTALPHSRDNGFADLAAYDDDGNRWIDENNSIYQRLRIWNRDATGKDTLLGQVAGSGLFFYENGGAGTVQQLNLVV